MWQALKQAEMLAFRDRVTSGLGPESVAELRDLLGQVAAQPDADRAICFHGAWALVHEADVRFADALRHREIEIKLIERLHEMVRSESESEYVLHDYGDSELAARREIGRELARLAADRRDGGLS